MHCPPQNPVIPANRSLHYKRPPIAGPKMLRAPIGEPLFLSRPFPREPAYTRAIVGRDNGLFLSCFLHASFFFAEAAVGCGGADRRGGRPGSALPGERYAIVPRRFRRFWKHEMFRRSAQTNSTKAFHEHTAVCSTVNRDAAFDMKSAQIKRAAQPKIIFSHLRVAQNHMFLICSHKFLLKEVISCNGSSW